MDADGSNKQQLTNNDTQDLSPAISPDGSQIVFSRQNNSSTNYEIWMMDIDGANATQLTTVSGYDDSFPGWSSDGSKIVFSSTRDGNGNIYMMNSDGSNQQQITTHSADDRSPDWSLQGEKIIFASDRDGNGTREIYVINADGTGLEKIIDDTMENGINLSDPAWSPDASKVAYQGFETNGSTVVFTANADGSNVQRLSTSTGSALQPDWSPDGVYISFVDLASGNNTDTIWIIKEDGSGEFRLTDDQGNRSSFPSWSPKQ